MKAKGGRSYKPVSIDERQRRPGAGRKSNEEVAQKSRDLARQRKSLVQFLNTDNADGERYESSGEGTVSPTALNEETTNTDNVSEGEEDEFCLLSSIQTHHARECIAMLKSKKQECVAGKLVDFEFIPCITTRAPAAEPVTRGFAWVPELLVSFIRVEWRCPRCSCLAVANGFNKPRRVICLTETRWIVSRQYMCKNCKAGAENKSYCFSGLDPNAIKLLPPSIIRLFPFSTTGLAKRSFLVETLAVRMVVDNVVGNMSFDESVKFIRREHEKTWFSQCASYLHYVQNLRVSTILYLTASPVVQPLRQPFVP